jgi:hypothetical protein
MASTYLSRTPASAGNRKTWTFSAWIKRGILGSSTIFTAGYNENNVATLKFDANDKISLFDYDGNTDYAILTNRLFRDTSAWYHIVLAVDTTNATENNRVRLYINGVQETSLTTNTQPSQNYDGLYNSNIAHYIGRYGWNSDEYFDGSMTHVHFIDGTAYDASTFGETDATTGIWKPKTAPVVTYGTNGFFLKFENSASFGTDSSPNGNNFTVNGTMTQTIDTPSNVFCTANALSKGSNVTLTNGNTTITKGAGFESCMATIMPSTGKWYWENKVSSLGTVNCGVTKSTQDGTTHASVDAGRSMYSSNGNIYNEGLASGDVSTGITFTTNDIIGVAIDIAGDTIAYYKNGTLIHTVSDSGISSAEGWSPGWGMNSGTFNVNFGNGYFGTTPVSSSENPDDGIGIFEYAVPAGYKALCTKSINAQEYN